MAIWRALQHVTAPLRDNRWENHERTSVSLWNESHNDPYYYSMQSYFEQMYMQPICHTSTFDHLVYDLPHYASEVLVGRKCSQAEEVGQGRMRTMGLRGLHMLL